MDIQDLTNLIRARRAIFPKNYDPNRPILRETIENLLENANWAPTHKNSQPWRFKVFHTPESRQKLGEYLLGWTLTHKPNEPLSPEKRAKILENPRRAGAVIALCIQPDPTLPLWEEIAALACAVQNMWLSCAALGIGGYWSSPRAAMEADDFLDLSENERCQGLFYLGWPLFSANVGTRNSVAEKTVWL